MATVVVARDHPVR